MDFFKNIATQFQQIWKQTTIAARIGIVLTTLLCVAAIVGVGFWSSQPQYMVLARNLTTEEYQRIVSRLETQGIPYQEDLVGSTVRVPKNKLSKALPIANEELGPNRVEADGLGSTLITDSPEVIRQKMLRAKEVSLAQTIARNRAVEVATVHISQGRVSPFVRDALPTTASVQLQLKAGEPFTREQTESIVALVANSVEGLSLEQVSVTDTDGHLLSSDISGLDAVIGRQEEYRRRVETDRASKAEWMLSRMLGPDRAIVRVTADIDFTESSRTSTTYDPDTKAKKTENIESSETKGASAPEMGPVGTASNIGDGGPTKVTNPISSTTENIQTTYETSSTVDVIKEAPGTIKRLTIATMVDLGTSSDDPNAAAAAGGTAPAVPTQDEIEAIVKTAVGFDSVRGDEITVLVTTLQGNNATTPIGAAAVPPWEQYNELLRNASLGLASVVAFILGLLIIRKMRPVVVNDSGASAITPERSRRIAELSSRALENPEALAKVMNVWLNVADQQTEAEANRPPQTRRAA